MKLKNSAYILSNLAQIICIAMLLLSLAEHPYIYYKILRWIVFLTSAYLTILYFRGVMGKWVFILAFIFVGIATLFNPVFPVYLDKVIWQIIDVCVALIFIAHISYENLRKESIKRLSITKDKDQNYTIH